MNEKPNDMMICNRDPDEHDAKNFVLWWNQFGNRFFHVVQENGKSVWKIVDQKMKLIHYTVSSIEYFEQREYSQKNRPWQDKPNGLWVSVEVGHRLPNNYDWKEWCESENYRTEALAFSYEIILKEDANILHLKTKEEIIEFSKQYLHGDDEWDTSQIEWHEVKKRYQGIIISPYQRDCRLCLETLWYYVWDCSSGCIWDLSCIKEFIQQKVHAQSTHL